MYWSVIYHDQGAWFLKSNFMKGFVRSVLSSLKFRYKKLLHCGSNKDINIRKVEFGEESKWKRVVKRNGKVKTVPRISFVFGCKATEEANTLNCMRHILDKVTWSLKTCKHNPMGALIRKYCDQNEVAICNYMIMNITVRKQVRKR